MLKLLLISLDKIIKIIRSSKTPEDAKQAILKTKWKINKSQKLISLVEGKKSKGLYSLSEPQVIAILELRLQKLTALGINEIEVEIKKLAELIAKYKKIISSKKELLKVISDELKNSLIGLGAIKGIYDKKYLVPFGEYVPLSGVFDRLFNFFNFNRPSIIAGEGTSLLGDDFIKISSAICYEIAYQETYLKNSDTSNLLFNASNDNWFGKTIGPYQHLQIARFRAAENQKYLIRSTSTGMSAFINDLSLIHISEPTRPY